MTTKRKPHHDLTNGYKKQHGIHHKHTERYLKIYWPYLPVLLFVIAGIASSVAIIYLKPYFSSANSNISVSTLLKSTNNARFTKHVSPLVLNPQLTSAAQAKANQMVSQNYWAPISPSGQTPWQIVQQKGYTYKFAGENMGYGFSSSSNLLSAWMNSASHSQNIINSNFSNVGFGIASSSNFQNNGPQTVVVAIYAAPANGVPVTKQAVSASAAPFTTASVTEPKSQTVTKIEAITNDYALNSIFISGLIVGIAGCYLVIKHTLILKKWVLEGEKVVIDHPYIDVIIIIFVVGLISLNQTVGIIR